MAQYRYSDREIKIAEWLGFKWQQSRHYSEDPHWTWPHGGVERFPRTPGGIPHFDNDDGAAISLFPALVEKGFTPLLHAHVDGWYVQIWGVLELPPDVRLKSEAKAETICSAISAAALKLIESI